MVGALGGGYDASEAASTGKGKRIMEASGRRGGGTWIDIARGYLRNYFVHKYKPCELENREQSGDFMKP